MRLARQEQERAKTRALRAGLWFSTKEIDMEENELNLRVWKVAAAFVCAMTAIIASCSAHETRAIVEMTEKGANPLDASCAISPGDRKCIVRYSVK